MEEGAHIQWLSRWLLPVLKLFNAHLLVNYPLLIVPPERQLKIVNRTPMQILKCILTPVCEKRTEIAKEEGGRAERPLGNAS